MCCQCVEKSDFQPIWQFLKPIMLSPSTQQPYILGFIQQIKVVHVHITVCTRMVPAQTAVATDEMQA